MFTGYVKKNYKRGLNLNKLKIHILESQLIKYFDFYVLPFVYKEIKYRL